MAASKVKAFLVPIILAIVAYNLGVYIVKNDASSVLTVLLGVAIFSIALGLETKYLVWVTMYILLMGSSSSYALRSQVYYFRFAIFGIFVLKELIYVLSFQAQEIKAKLSRWSAIHTFFLFYVLIAFISVPNSIAKDVSFKRAIALAVLFGAVFWHLFRVCDTYESLDSLLRNLLKAGAGLLIIGFLSYLSGHQGSVHSSGRLRLFMYGPNELGYFCALFFPGLLWLYFAARTRKEKLFVAAAVILFGSSVVLSASRGALVCTLLTTFIQLLLAYRKHAVMGALLLVLVGSSIYLIFPPNTDTIYQSLEDNIIRPDSLSTGSGRLPIWEAAWDLHKQRPMTGFGFGVGERLFREQYFAGVTHEFQGGTLHNSYLEILLDLGWPGLLCMLVILGIAMSLAITLCLKLRGNEHFRFSVVLLCVLLYAVSSSVFESWLISPGNIFSFPFWICVMSIVRLYWLAKQGALDQPVEDEA